MKETIYVGLTEQCVMSYPDPRMEGWRFYRIEYCGFNEDCRFEGTIWLPQNVDPGYVEELLRKWQE